MANSHWDHTWGSRYNEQWPQAPQPPSLALNHVAAPLPRASYANSNYYASLQSSYSQGNPSVFSQQQRNASILTRNITSVHPHLDSTSHSAPPIRSFRHGPGGPHRCAQPGCPWSGPTPEALKIHKMDRHLIFPPGWKPRKGPPDGEGGFNMPILGTGITLNTPESIDAWIAERKKKWPSTSRIEEKLKNRAEAIERGELIPENPRKRKRNDESMSLHRGRSRGRGTTHGTARGSFPRGYGQVRGRGRGRGTIILSASAPGPTFIPGSRSAGLPSPLVKHDSSSASDTESPNSDMDPVKDAISSKLPVSEDVQLASCGDSDVSVEELDTQTKPEVPQSTTQPPALSRKAPRRPRVIRHPFAQRPPLLKQLLLPEVRHTVSNLSQAIRFLVDNDFLENVELKPGDAENPLIEEVKAVADDAKTSTSS